MKHISKTDSYVLTLIDFRIHCFIAQNMNALVVYNAKINSIIPIQNMFLFCFRSVALKNVDFSYQIID